MSEKHFLKFGLPAAGLGPPGQINNYGNVPAKSREANDLKTDLKCDGTSALSIAVKMIAKT